MCRVGRDPEFGARTLRQRRSGNDGVLSHSSNDTEIAWYENTDGAGSFGARQVICAFADSAQPVFATHIDGDGAEATNRLLAKANSGPKSSADVQLFETAASRRMSCRSSD
jgi:hypothetical protein